MSDCKVHRREIEGAADGGALSGAARAHAALCRACGEGLRERERLRALVGGLGKVEAPADFEFRLRARMAAAKIDGGRGRFSGARWLYGFAPVAVAACFVVVSATLYFRQAARPKAAPASAVADAPARGAGPDRITPVNAKGTPDGPAVDTTEVARSNRASVAPPRIRRPVYRLNVRAAQPREVASKGESRAAEVGASTLVSSVTAAPILMPINEPLRVILRDESGAERVVPMRSFSFGSQDFLSRGAPPKPSAVTEVGGVW